MKFTAPKAALLSAGVVVVLSGSPGGASASGMPDNLIMHATAIEQLEWQGDGRFVWEMEGWSGTSLNRLTYAVESDVRSGHSPEHEFSLGWQKAITAFWDAKTQLRYDKAHDGDVLRLGAGLTGTLPYFVHFDGVVMFGSGDVLLDLELIHELPLNQNWKFESRVDVEVINGLEEASVGVRLQHESANRLTRYVGIEWQRSPLDKAHTALVAGVSYWY